MKCLPLKCSTNGFGAVKLIRFAGWNFAPGPLLGGPSSILQEEGASTDVTGTVVCSRADIIAENGGRTSPEKLKPSGVLDSYLKGGGKMGKENTKDGVNYMVRALKVRFEILREGDIEIF